MRTPIIAANWKMFKTIAEAVDYCREITPRLAPFAGVERVICPSFVALATVRGALDGTGIKVGAQNVAANDSGAYTSQISPVMLVDFAEYVIIGHSEARQYLGESDADVNAKIKAALRHGLKPIVAVGEKIETRQSGDAEPFVEAQVRAAFTDVDAASVTNIVIAYEPIWAIGTGMSATQDDAQTMCAKIRAVVASLYGAETANAVRIQYGGSVKPDNMAAYMGQPDIDGALVGGASLKVDDFTRLVEIAAQAKGV